MSSTGNLLTAVDIPGSRCYIRAVIHWAQWNCTQPAQDTFQLVAPNPNGPDFGVREMLDGFDQAGAGIAPGTYDVTGMRFTEDR
jgi:hypothetical protein